MYPKQYDLSHTTDYCLDVGETEKYNNKKKNLKWLKRLKKLIDNWIVFKVAQIHKRCGD